MKAATKPLWREIKDCLEFCKTSMSSFMVQTPVKGKTYKEGQERKDEDVCVGVERERERLCKKAVKFPYENLLPFQQNASDKR